MKKQQVIFYLFLLLIAACSANQPEKKETALQQQVTDFIQQEHEANRFDGTVVIGTATEILAEVAIGTADRAHAVPMKLEHRFDIASLNKSFIGALVMIAVEEGKLQLEDKLVDVLQNYEYTGSFHADITLHQMLCHSAGLADYNGIADSLKAGNFRAFKRKHVTNAAYVDFISQLQPIAAPNEQFYYSNFAYHLLAIILEDAFGKPFPELLHEKITKPLQMNHTYASTNNEAVHQDEVEAYNYMESRGEWMKNDFIDLTLGRRIFSTTQDLYRWAKAMDSDVLLRKESRQLIQTNHLKAITEDISYGYGWVVFDEPNSHYKMGKIAIEKPYIIHGGNTGGFKSILVNVNQGEYIIAILSNIGSRTNELKMAEQLAQLVVNVE